MSNIRPPLAWHRQLAVALLQDIWLKAIGTPLFIGLFFGVYVYLLKRPVSPVAVMPLTWLDHFISFQPAAFPLYLSLWVYVSLPPAMLSHQRELFGYAVAMAVNCLIGLLIFYFWPTSVPATTMEWSLYPGMGFLKSMDAAGNACPSLHVATAVFSAIWLSFILRRFGVPGWIRYVNWAWCIGIIYSTVAIRQHVVVDVAAGAVLGSWVAYLSLRRRFYV